MIENVSNKIAIHSCQDKDIVKEYLEKYFRFIQVQFECDDNIIDTGTTLLDSRELETKIIVEYVPNLARTKLFVIIGINRLKTTLKKRKVPTPRRIILICFFSWSVNFFNFTKIRNICIFTGRSRGIIKKLGISRFVFRNLGDNGLIYGLKRAT